VAVAADLGAVIDVGVEVDEGAADVAVAADLGAVIDVGVEVDEGAADVAVGTPEPVDTEGVFVDTCLALRNMCGPNAPENCGSCQYRVSYRADACTPQQLCSDTFVYWSAFGCEHPGLSNMFRQLNEAYPNLVTVCLQPHFPGETLPSSLGAPERDNAVIEAAFDRLRLGGDLGIWDGANLMFGGCSIGATRYPVVAGRLPDDSNWLGSRKTAVCMSDGVVDVNHQLQFVAEGTGDSCPGRVQRVVQSYRRTGSQDCGGMDCMTFDSIVTADGEGFMFNEGVSTADFAATHWRLFTEGRAFDSLDTQCEQDVVNGAPMEALCGLIDASPDHACEFQAFPDAPHCSVYTRDIATLCVDWFLSL